MKYELPHTIENPVGERLTFKSLESSAEGDKLLVEAVCRPGAGPIMHTHFKQDESLTVVSGKIGYQILGEEPKYASQGETVLFKRGVPHRFWGEGEEETQLKGWIQPANSIVYYLSAIYAAQNKSGKDRPEAFDAAWLSTRYSSEYDMPELPWFVKKIIFPATCLIGKALGKYEHFKDAPAALK